MDEKEWMRPKERGYVKYLSRRLSGLLPRPLTDENVFLVEDVAEAIRCVEIVYGVGAGGSEMVEPSKTEEGNPMDDTNELYISNIAQRLRGFSLEMIRAIYMVVVQMEQLLERSRKE